ncbi:SH3 domain-containing kinase-binding protein 1 [Orussus abietinus]|uniref:SH3 domain-containing kinase-binding protein 1 n=1 Tax=Orussus abietinus TaxID=222816 RepID=UPI00062692EE|nr:SH3 domain-containing kinase-binding protein 1 [Orussus abietinus]
MEARVEYNYVAQEPDELTLKKGDIIKEIKVMFGGWWEGTLRDKRGMFPDNFVKVLEPSSPGGGGEGNSSLETEDVTLRNGASAADRGKKWCKVLFNYEPCNEDELTLIPQDMIEFLGEVEEGWWKGRLRGRIGVFPSNFVSSPAFEEPEAVKERDKKELCRVIFPYESVNKDELTLVEGDIITLLSRDAPDKGWWKGELRGQIGLFPDNFVEVIGVKGDQHHSQEQSQATSKSSTKPSHGTKKSEKAHIRKSLNSRNIHTESSKKSSLSSSVSSSSTLIGIVGGSGDKKISGNHSLMSSLKRIVGEEGSNNDNGATTTGLDEELDGVERGEGTPLSHLTASRAKAPRRRLPSTQHLRQTSISAAPLPPNSSAANVTTTTEDSLANGNIEATSEQLRDKDTEGPTGRVKRFSPWVEELRMSQMERMKVSSVDRVDKVEVKKEKGYSRLMTSSTAESAIKPDPDAEDTTPKEKDKNQRIESSSLPEPPTCPGTATAYVPYILYSQLLERVTMLEEKQIILQRTVNQLSEQLVPLLGNVSTNNKA